MTRSDVDGITDDEIAGEERLTPESVPVSS
jgi:hypothetical protein